MKANKGGIILSIAAAAVFSTASFSMPADQSKMDSGVKCMGINSCKGHSACKTAANSCKGQNSCKGKGFLIVKDEKMCTKEGGTVMQ